MARVCFMRQVSHFNIRTTLQTHCAIRMKLTVASRFFIYLRAFAFVPILLFTLLIHSFDILLSLSHTNSQTTNMHCTRVVCVFVANVYALLFHCLLFISWIWHYCYRCYNTVYNVTTKSVNRSHSLLRNLRLSAYLYILIYTFCSQ